MKNLLRTVALTMAIRLAPEPMRLNGRSDASFDKPGGFPERALTMICPLWTQAGGSGQVAAAMAEWLQD